MLDNGNGHAWDANLLAQGFDARLESGWRRREYAGGPAQEQAR
jgi:hypothetical protein